MMCHPVSCCVVKSVANVTIGFCDTLAIPQQCRNIRESLWYDSLQDDSTTEAPQTEDEEPLVYDGEDEEDETFYSPEARSSIINCPTLIPFKLSII